MKKGCILFLLAVCVSSCSSRYASNGEHIYNKSNNGPRLVVPKPLVEDNINHFYDLPSQNEKVKADPAPPTSN